MGSMIEAYFRALNLQFHIMGITFTLLDVFYAGIILTLIGMALGKIFFFASNKR